MTNNTSPTLPQRPDAAKARADLIAAQAAEREALDREHALLSELPDSAFLARPLVSNHKQGPDGEETAWLSFRPDFGEAGERYNPAQVLADLEAAGFAPVPLSRVTWDNYRPSVWPSRAENVPAERPDICGSKCKANAVQAVAPLYLKCSVGQGFASQEALAFYRTPAGRLLRVCVETSAPVHILASREQFENGEWRYRRGAQLRLGPNVQALRTPDGASVADALAFVFYTLPTSLDGEVWYTPNTEQAAFPLTPSAMLAQIIAPAQPANA